MSSFSGRSPCLRGQDSSHGARQPLPASRGRASAGELPMRESVREVDEGQQDEVSRRSVGPPEYRAGEIAMRCSISSLTLSSCSRRSAPARARQLRPGERIEQKRVRWVGQAVVIHRQGNRLGAAQRLAGTGRDRQCRLLAGAYGTQPHPSEQFVDRAEAVVDRADGHPRGGGDRLDRRGARAAIDHHLAGSIEDRIG